MNNLREPLSRPTAGITAGLVSGLTALAVAELVAAVIRPQAGPVNAVGAAAIDLTPAPVKDFAIRTFGEDDKVVLQLGILAVLALLAAALGLAALNHRRVATAGVLVFGLVGGVAALSRPDSTGPVDVLPSVAGAVVGALVLYWLAGRAADVAAPAPGEVTARGPARRSFLAAAAGTAVASVAAASLGRHLAGRSGRGATASRQAVRLPAPASPAPPLPGNVQPAVAGISPFTTPTGDFYRVDTALVVPRVDADTWRLRIHGKGARTRTYSLSDLLARPLIERDITLTCVSNEVGGPYIGTARWLGVPLADLLREAGVRPPSQGGEADQLVARSVDGMTLGSPVEDVMDGRDAVLAVGMNGRPLPFDHGFPVRMLVPGLYGYVSACKWITDIELTTFDAYDPYWVKRNWARKAPVKTQSRIDTPKPFARLSPGTVPVAGVAWAQRRGINRVEVRIDEGPWQDADLAPQATVDTWRQWSYPWQATPGGHTISVRATDGDGAVQTEQRTRTTPDGASGWHGVFTTVT
ncbi:molybdopterin-dependent oxidoreductase [Streptomyces sp. NPDC058662]|uniref:molybdopterin-dependent oxidoreductase n=1 Tax=Streptomyces sp. NPDC058662 TaxID=3346583 RepID=UPI0036664E89